MLTKIIRTYLISLIRNLFVISHAKMLNLQKKIIISIIITVKVCEDLKMLNNHEYKKMATVNSNRWLEIFTCCICTWGVYMHILCQTLNDFATWHDHHVCSVLPSLMNYNSLLEMEVDSDTYDW